MTHVNRPGFTEMAAGLGFGPATYFFDANYLPLGIITDEYIVVTPLAEEFRSGTSVMTTRYLAVL